MRTNNPFLPANLAAAPLFAVTKGSFSNPWQYILRFASHKCPHLWAHIRLVPRTAAGIAPAPQTSQTAGRRHSSAAFG